MKQTGEGRWFVDFGKAAFGTIQIDIEADTSMQLTVELAEKLAAPDVLDSDPPGCVRYRKIPVQISPGRQTIQVEIAPDERNTGEHAIKMPDDLFEVLPFRYAAIQGSRDGFTLHGATQLAVEYPFDETAAAFECSDERLNRVWDMCHHSIRATSFLGIYVDGDRERIPYEADAYINQLGHYCVDAEYEMARATLEHLLFHPTWPTEWALHFVPIAWADYQYTGSTDMLEAYYDGLRTKMLLPLAREDGLISTQTGLLTDELLESLYLDAMKDIVDWPPADFDQGVPGERDNYEMAPVNTVVNAFHCWNLGLYSQVAAVLGRDDDSSQFRERYRDVANSFHRAFFDDARGIYLDGEGSTHASLHANMFPLAFGLVPKEHQARVTDFVCSRGMACSVYGSQFLLEALYGMGEAEHALGLMTAEHDRGWLNMLQAGSTVSLEAWDAKYKSNLDWNHAWGAAPANIIPRFLMGVRPADPGFSTVLIAPQPADLEDARAKVPTPLGPVSLDIRRHPRRDACAVRVEVPSDAAACIDLTGMLPGPATVTVDGIQTTVTELRDRVLPGGKHEVIR